MYSDTLKWCDIFQETKTCKQCIDKMLMSRNANSFLKKKNNILSHFILVFAIFSVIILWMCPH